MTTTATTTKKVQVAPRPQIFKPSSPQALKPRAGGRSSDQRPATSDGRAVVTKTENGLGGRPSDQRPATSIGRAGE